MHHSRIQASPGGAGPEFLKCKNLRAPRDSAVSAPLQFPVVLTRLWRQTLSVAAVFWALWLILVALEATMGAHFILGGLYLFSLPLLVGSLTWSTRELTAAPRRGVGPILIHGACVLVLASIIVLVGLLAAARLKAIMLGT